MSEYWKSTVRPGVLTDLMALPTLMFCPTNTSRFPAKILVQALQNLRTGHQDRADPARGDCEASRQLKTVSARPASRSRAGRTREGQGQAGSRKAEWSRLGRCDEQCIWTTLETKGGDSAALSNAKASYGGRTDEADGSTGRDGCFDPSGVQREHGYGGRMADGF